MIPRRVEEGRDTSYTFAVCNAALPEGYKAAEEEAFRLQEQPEPDPAVFHELIDRLTARYPCICDPTRADSDDGPWCSGPLRQKRYTRATVLGLIFSRVDEVLPFVIETATAMGLTVVDWQTGQVHRGGKACHRSTSKRP